MFGLSAGLIVELSVAILLATTIGYCVILNRRLKRLHADRDQLRQMVADLVQATGLANAAIHELKTAARNAEQSLSGRLAEGESFSARLDEQMAAGARLLERISRIAAATPPRAGAEPRPEPRVEARVEPRVEARVEPQVEPPVPAALPQESNRLKSALEQLASRPRISGTAA